ncbi:MAG: UDP-N-acetylmuramoyl-L-alanyl-D-glutamate--2,6-diaminopimelate ligase [Planctomycetota bacterium]
MSGSLRASQRPAPALSALLSKAGFTREDFAPGHFAPGDLGLGDLGLGDLGLGDLGPAHGGDPPLSATISTLSHDSRNMIPGGCFVAVDGSSIDGHAFVPQAVERGARTVILQRDVPVAPGVTKLIVGDTRTALARLAAAYYGVGKGDANGLRLIGITGTNGKSTVAWLTRSIINAGQQRCALIGTIEYDLVSRRIDAPLTTPGPVDLSRHLAEAATADAAFGVLEVSSHALDQRRTDGLEFEAAVFTNLSGDHLDYHGTKEAYLACKTRLFTQLGPAAVAVINGDDACAPHVRESATCRTLTFAIDDLQAQFTAHDIRSDIRGSRFRVAGEDLDLELAIRMPGTHNIYNALAAAVTAYACGIDADATAHGLASVHGVPGRLQRVESDDCPFAVLVDYAHTDDALENVLRTLRPLTAGRLICVFGCGGDRDRSKRPRMAQVAQRYGDLVLATSDNPRTEDPEAILADIATGFSGDTEDRVRLIVDRREAIGEAIAIAQEGDTVLIAGKGHETYQIVGDEIRVFDDVLEARKVLGNVASGA